MSTIKDVAKAAGVSIATVSRVLHNPNRVSATTRDHVLTVVKELDYIPNFAAQSLRRHTSKKILVTVPDISNPFFSNVIRGAEKAAREFGYAIVLGDTRYEIDREEQYADMLLRHEVDGLVFLGHHLPSNLKDLIAKKGPLAPIVNACEYSTDLPVHSVHIDNKAAAALAIQHLYSLGHEQIGIITGPSNNPLTRDRLAGVKKAANEKGLQTRLTLQKADFTIEAGAQAAQALFLNDNPPSALFCFSDEMAMGALSTLQSLGINCPKAVSVVGFDDIRYASFTHPALTTVSQPMSQIGFEAIRLLLGTLDGTHADQRFITLPHDLIIRKSTGPVPKT
jgi:LacI family repressor for deo operon, udp, cdd, tsx, nupC, and nupG